MPCIADWFLTSVTNDILCEECEKKFVDEGCWW